MRYKKAFIGKVDKQIVQVMRDNTIKNDNPFYFWREIDNRKIKIPYIETKLK